MKEMSDGTKGTSSPKPKRVTIKEPSGRSPSGKGKKKLTLKDQLIAENNELRDELTKLGDENKTLRDKLEAVAAKIIDSSEDREEFESQEELDVSDVPMSDLLDMLQKIIVKSKTRKKGLLELRVEELETRLTQQSVDLAKTSRAKIAYEYGLQAVCLCPDVEQVRAKVEQVKLDVDGPQWTAPVYSTKQSSAHPMSYKALNDSFNSGNHNVPFNPPRPKLPGDTHINQLIKELRLFLVRELSMQKASRADWRMMAERVGIRCDVIDEWEEQRLEYPMSKVFAEWSRSDSATVRLLHRHLVSPQMRCVILAKRLADYYDVV